MDSTDMVVSSSCDSTSMVVRNDDWEKDKREKRHIAFKGGRRQGKTAFLKSMKDYSRWRR